MKTENKFGGVMIILVLLVLMFLCHVIFDIPWYALILALIGLFVLAIASMIIEDKISEKTAENIIKAKLIKETDFYKKKHEYSGCSYGKAEGAIIIHTKTFWITQNARFW